jgi:hypothetical protein
MKKCAYWSKSRKILSILSKIKERGFGLHLESLAPGPKGRRFWRAGMPFSLARISHFEKNNSIFRWL